MAGIREMLNEEYRPIEIDGKWCVKATGVHRFGEKICDCDSEEDARMVANALDTVTRLRN